MITRRITSRGRTTVPPAVSDALGLRDGDDLSYEITGDRVVLTKAPVPQNDPFAEFDEWKSEADRRVYAGL